MSVPNGHSVCGRGIGCNPPTRIAIGRGAVSPNPGVESVHIRISIERDCSVGGNGPSENAGRIRGGNFDRTRNILVLIQG